MRLFSKKKKQDMHSNSPDDFNIDDIDLPPLPEPPQPMNYNPNLPRRSPPQLVQQAPPNYPQMQQQPLAPQIQQQKKEKEDNNVKAPVFVRIDKYKEVLNSVKSLRGDLEKLNVSLDSLRESKSKEEEIIAGWNGLLSEVASKLNRIDDELFEPEE